jgi:hypothetical protein
MSYKDNIKSFNKFNAIQEINEMASSLTKLGVSKIHMQFIHKLTGKIHKMSQRGDAQIDPRTGREVSKFHTREEPVIAKGGIWPEREDIPLSHDVEVRGTKTGKKNIVHYLTSILDSRRDSGLKLILVNPNEDLIHYLTRKTGKLDRHQLRAAGYDDTPTAREHGVSQKRGLYMRSVSIDGDSGTPAGAWEGTIGQMSDHMDDDSILYILEDEDRVREKRKARSAIVEVTPDSFLKYFTDNFKNIASRFMEKSNIQKKTEWSDEMSKISPSDWQKMNEPENKTSSKLNKLASEIENSNLDENSLKPKLHNFQELAFKEGEYNTENDEGGDKASLTHMAEIHTLPVVASMFLQYLVLGRVNKSFYTDDPFKELGIDDLLFDD